jgi:hypothetical protein
LRPLSSQSLFLPALFVGALTRFVFLTLLLFCATGGFLLLTLTVSCLTGGLRLTIGLGLCRCLTLTFRCLTGSLCLPVGLCLRRCLTLAVSFYSCCLLGRAISLFLLHLRSKKSLPIALCIRGPVIAWGRRSWARSRTRSRTRRACGCVV